MDWSLEEGKKALEKMRGRASCRRFSSEAVPKELVRELIETGLCAASAGNLQPISIIVSDTPEQNKRLGAYSGGLAFVPQAPVNLIFALDWHKLGVYARGQKAPFTCDRNFMSFLMGTADVMCVAQTIETAAHLVGLGSCYVGNINHYGAQVAKELNLPQGAYPMLMLSLGFPEREPKPSKKLPYEIMVFHERYPDLGEAEITEAFEKKYGGLTMRLPENEPYRGEFAARLRSALSASYPPEESEEIVAEALRAGYLNELQRRFTITYHAKERVELGAKVEKQYEEQGIRAFHR